MTPVQVKVMEFGVAEPDKTGAANATGAGITGGGVVLSAARSKVKRTW